MQPTAKTISKFLRVSGELIELLTDAELNDFIRSMPRKPQLAREQVSYVPRPSLSEGEITAIVSELDAVLTREEAMSVLENHALSRKELIAIGKRKSAHITKQDTIGHIREKLVEAFVGAKLSSTAIRGKTSS